MHRTAEYGIAAHWKYKESGGKSTPADKSEMDKNISWLRQLLDWQKDIRDTGEYMES